MIIISTLYLLLVYLLFFKLKWLPWNKATQAATVVLGVVILSLFLVGLQGLTPASTQAYISGPVVEIAPQVSGRVIAVPIEANVAVEPGATLFEIDPRPYQYRVDQLQAQLVDTESSVAQLKEAYDAARANTRATEEQLALVRLRLDQQQQLVDRGAGSRFELEQYESQEQQLSAQLEAALASERAARLDLDSSVGGRDSRVVQVLSQLESAQFDLESTVVTAPGPGVVTVLTLRPGMQVSPTRSVAAFVATDDLRIVGNFEQKALQAVKVGDLAMINFPALPGRVFEAQVATIPQAIGEGQIVASGQLFRIGDQRMTRQYPILVSLPDDFPTELQRVGVAASVRIHTENAGVVGIVAIVLQWVQTSLDAVL
jgi:multidrug resistance efflux pump